MLSKLMYIGYESLVIVIFINCEYMRYKHTGRDAKIIHTRIVTKISSLPTKEKKIKTPKSIEKVQCIWKDQLKMDFILTESHFQFVIYFIGNSFIYICLIQF